MKQFVKVIDKNRPCFTHKGKKKASVECGKN